MESMAGKQRLRVTFSKGPRLKYISHLDLALTWERALRRAGVPLAYSQGHNPQAKLQLASGLPLGYIGCAEVMDVILTEPLSPVQLAACLQPVLPQGLSVIGIEEVPLKSPSLQSALRQAVYRVRLETLLTARDLERRIRDLLAVDRLEGQRIRKQRAENFDLRPLVHDLWLEGADQGQAVLGMRLSAGQRGHARPEAVLAALDVPAAGAHVERSQLLFEFDSH